MRPGHEDRCAVGARDRRDESRAISRETRNVNNCAGRRRGRSRGGYRGGGALGVATGRNQGGGLRRRRPKNAPGNPFDESPPIRLRQRVTLTEAMRWGYLPTLIRLISLRVARSMIDNSSEARLLT